MKNVYRQKVTLFFSSICNRMMFFLLLIPLFSLIMFFIVTYRYVIDIIDSRIYSNFQLTLDASADNLRICVDDMHNVSSNLIFYGSPLNNEIENFYLSKDQVSRDAAQRYIESTLISYEFKSATIGMVAVFDVTEGRMLASSDSNLQYGKIAGLDSFFEYIYDEVIHMPHKSISVYSQDDVISLYRPFATRVLNHEFAIYIESNKKLLNNLFNSYYQYDAATFSMEKYLTSNDNIIVYTPYLSILPADMDFTGALDAHNVFDKYNVLSYSDPRWSMYGLVEKSIYQQTYWQLLERFIISLFLFLLLHTLICFSIWRLVYNPIKAFNAELKSLRHSHLLINKYSESAAEFDEFRSLFNSMRVEIHRLVAQAEIEAMRVASLENELLLSRINPHFLYNTIDKIKWIAKSANDFDVANMLTALNNLMYYILGKKKTTSLREELRAIEDYLRLQKLIKPFRYDIAIDVNDAALDMIFPCFIMQPIVENSLLHGYIEQFAVTISATETADSVFINISDNGKGMSDDKLDNLKNGINAQTMDGFGIGIGLSYVFQALRMMYADTASVSIKSVLGEGTSFSLNIKKTK